MMPKLNLIVGYLTSACCGLLGFVILLSIANNQDAYFINLLIGTPITIFSLLFYKRSRLSSQFIYKMQHINYAIYDLIIQACILLFFLLLLAMAIYRTLHEGYAVFG